MVATTTLYSTSEEALVARLVKRDSKAFEELYDKYHKALYNSILRIIPSTELAEEVLQETFVKIWHNIGSYNADKGRLYTWMHNIARNLSVDVLRSKDFRNNSKNQDLENIVNTGYEPSGRSYNTDTIGIKALLNKLKPEQKEVMQAVYFDGYTHVEAAERLDIPLGTVKTRIRLAIIELRQYFNKE